jgi:hypothetical protein
MAQGEIKSKLGSAKGKKPGVDAKKGKRTIAPKRKDLVKNARMIKVCDVISLLLALSANRRRNILAVSRQ